jgi:hypothetical protein
MSAVWAQTAPPLLLITTIKVKPEMRQEWIDMQRTEVTPAYKKAGITNYQVFNTALFGDADEFTTALSITNAATFDGELPMVKALGSEGSARLLAKLRKCTVSVHRILVRERGDLTIDSEMTAPPKLMVLTSVTVKAGMALDYERWVKTEVLPGLKKGGQKMYLVAELDKPSALVAGLGQEGADKVLSHATMVEHVERNVYRLMPELSIFGAPGTN